MSRFQVKHSSEMIEGEPNHKALREAQEDADRSADSASHRDITFMLDGVRRRLGLEVP